MIKKLVPLVVFLFLGIMAMAQEPETGTEPEPIPDAPTRNFRIGVRTGGAISTLSPGNLTNPSTMFGLMGGMTARFKFGTIHDDKPEAYKFGFETQLGVVYKGSNFKNNNGEYNKISLFYGELATYGLLKITKTGNVKLMAGPYAGYLITSSIYIKPQTYMDTTELKLNPFDYGVGIGLEYKTLPIGFQLVVKRGLGNIDRGINFLNYPNIKTAFNGGQIRNFTVELVLSF